MITRLVFIVCLCVPALVACRRSPGISPGQTPTAAAYYLVSGQGARTFSRPDQAALDGDGPAPPEDLAAHPLLAGFGLSIVEQRFVNGRRVGRTGQGRWIAMAHLVAARSSPFAGVTLPARAVLDFAWVVAPSAPVFARASADANPTATQARLSRLRLSDPCPPAARSCQTEIGWMRATDLRVPTAAPRPPGVGPTERWIDVDLTTQTLVAYSGDQPVFSTLVSTGIGRPGSPLSTPRGIHRVHTKLRRATMDNLEHTGVAPYRYEDIPAVQYFTDRAALHAALWHDRFGHPASHGCVNLAPSDADRLFAFTAPSVPPGREAVATGAAGTGTVIRVR